MNDNQSNTPEQDQNNNPGMEQEPTYSDIITAIESGNSAELDRLMAVETAKQGSEFEFEDKDEEEEEEGNTAQRSPEPEPKEAAPDAASTADDNTDKQKPDELEEIRRELHRVKSEAGRVAALQRKVSELEGQLRASRARTSATEQPEQGSSTQPAKVEIPDNVRNRIEQLRAVDPDLADTLQEMYTASTQSDQRTREDIMREVEEQRQSEEADRHFAEQKALLSEWIPEHEQVFASNEWSAWKDTLLPGQRAMAESGYAVEVAQAINAFAHWLRASQGPDQKSSTSSEGGDPNQRNNTNVSNGQVQNPVVEQRNRKIEASAGVRNAPAKAHEEFDADKYFSEVYTQLGKSAGIIK